MFLLQDSDSGLQYLTPTQSLSAAALQTRRSREAMMRTSSMESLQAGGVSIAGVCPSELSICGEIKLESEQ